MLRNLGPGLLFAASAVGVSHLVQSTRAGAEFGLTMGLLIVGICIVKYPAFRFGAEYAAATGESVVDAYGRDGRWLLVFFLVALTVEGLVAVPAVSLVAAGLTLNLTGLGTSEVGVTLAIIAVSSVALAFGRYPMLEWLSKFFVILFAVLTAFATFASLRLLTSDRPLAGPIELTDANLNFSVAVSGWMPVGMGAAVFISSWVLARGAARGQRFAVAQARFDFNVGYVVTVVLALCFLLMGTLLMFGRQIEFAGGSTGFASGLVGLFADSLGPWIRPVIGIAAIAVMLSTVIAVIDAFPRAYADVLRRLLGIDPSRGQGLYLGMLAVQALIAFLILGLLFRSFAIYIDFATTAGFVSAPAIAILNHRVMTSPSMPVDQRPSPVLRVWSAAGAAVLTAASLGYLYFRFV